MADSVEPLFENLVEPVIAPVIAPVAPKTAKPVKAAKPVKTVSKPEPKAPAAPKTAKTKDIIMTKTTDFTAAVKTAFSDIQGKAKTAYAKGTEVAGEAGAFTKGNVEALVESGKILAAGVKDLSTGFVAESKGAFETLTADVKELAAAKSPTDFFKLQSDLLRKQFDATVAFNSKQGEAMLKLVGEAAAPVKGRVSLAVEAIKKVA